jgi:hypothetical protein
MHKKEVDKKKTNKRKEEVSQLEKIEEKYIENIKNTRQKTMGLKFGYNTQSNFNHTLRATPVKKLNLMKYASTGTKSKCYTARSKSIGIRSGVNRDDERKKTPIGEKKVGRFTKGGNVCKGCKRDGNGNSKSDKKMLNKSAEVISGSYKMKEEDVKEEVKKENDNGNDGQKNGEEVVEKKEEEEVKVDNDNVNENVNENKDVQVQNVQENNPPEEQKQE